MSLDEIVRQAGLLESLARAGEGAGAEASEGEEKGWKPESFSVTSGENHIHTMIHARVTNVPENPKQLWLEAIEAAFSVEISERGSAANPTHWQRRASALSFEQAFDLIQPFNPHWVIMYRDEAYFTGRQEDCYWDFGGCNIGENGYGDVFMYIRVKDEPARKLFEKYGLHVDWY